MLKYFNKLLMNDKIKNKIKILLIILVVIPLIIIFSKTLELFFAFIFSLIF